MHIVRIVDIHKIIASEKSALTYISNKLIDKPVRCPMCRSKKFYLMNRGNFRCRNCKIDYNPLSSTHFSIVNIPLYKWLALIKLFELSISARKAAIEAGVSYPTALKAFGSIRRTIAEELAKKDRKLKGEIELDEAYFGGKRKGNRGRGAGNKVIVFGILERKGKVSVDIVPNVSAETLLQSTVKKVRRGSIVYTDKWKSYDSLMFCGYRHLQIDHGKRFSRGKVYINGIEGFWSFAKERLIKFHGISPRKFPYYIKEQEWRYNNKDKNLFELIVNYMLGVIGL